MFNSTGSVIGFENTSIELQSSDFNYTVLFSLDNGTYREFDEYWQDNSNRTFGYFLVIGEFGLPNNGFSITLEIFCIYATLGDYDDYWGFDSTNSETPFIFSLTAILAVQIIRRKQI